MTKPVSLERIAGVREVIREGKCLGRRHRHFIGEEVI
jgi:hypothetical protein